jgi:F-type H+-transporting ATPase subunit epsilon
VADTLTLTIVTPERALVEAEAAEVILPGLNGYLGVLPGHAPLFAELTVGRLTYRGASGSQSLAIAGGFVEVFEDHVRVLASVAEPASGIDVTRAKDAYGRAGERLGGEGEGVDFDRALAASHRAATRLEVAGQSPPR